MCCVKNRPRVPERLPRPADSISSVCSSSRVFSMPPQARTNACAATVPVLPFNAATRNLTHARRVRVRLDRNGVAVEHYGHVLGMFEALSIRRCRNASAGCNARSRYRPSPGRRWAARRAFPARLRVSPRTVATPARSKGRGRSADGPSAVGDPRPLGKVDVAQRCTPALPATRGATEVAYAATDGTCVLHTGTFTVV